MINSIATKKPKPVSTILNVRLALVAAALLCVSAEGYADSSVWKVSGNHTELYLGGTVHMLQPEDHPLPEPFAVAYNDADEIYLETNLEQSQTPAFQAKMLRALTFQNGNTLSQTLNDTTLLKLDEHLKSRGMTRALFEAFKPSGLSLTLSTIELQRMGMDPKLGVDMYFQTKAKEDGLAIHSLETIEEQLMFIQRMDNTDPNKIILYTLRDIQDLGTILAQLKGAWRDGDIKALNELGLKEMQAEFAEVYRALIKTRNDAWLKKIKTMLETPNKEFVLVGALHLAGNDGLLTLLKEAGYRVEQLKTKK